MKKLSLIALLLLSVSFNALASDCMMVKELKVEFVNDSTKFVDKEKEKQKILEFKDFIKATDLYVLIEGHTNNISTARYNYDLSSRRAVKVMEKLVENGLSKNHVRAMGFGESSPLYSNDTEDGLAKNRRVIAEVFNTAAELDEYIKSSKKRIKNIKFQEQ